MGSLGESSNRMRIRTRDILVLVLLSMGTISYCQQANVDDINFQLSWPIDITRNKVIAELPYIGKQYKISFEVLISKFEFSQDYLNIIHFTLGQDAAVYGDRVPAVWIYKDKVFHISSA